ncbi:MAG: SUMF1/EgtB/PvdO family nonheme iron enzyme [Candidatus Schekmanbacteria bacterium]|nr:SUMF1/EgtB/PvdO family nonheme iron enzyme [Candidatus Schekmanbacteria bacterium]
MNTKYLMSAAVIGLLLSKSAVFAQEKKLENMVLVPAGEYTIGLTNDQVKNVVTALEGMEKYHDNAQPAHKVKLDAFYIDVYEVTNRQYKEFCDATKRNTPEYWEDGAYPKALADHPVVNVTWHDAVAYAQWKGKRLPTEFEWEAAARGTDGRLFPWGDKYDAAKTNCEDGGPGNTTPVGKYKGGVSPFGVYDLSGSVAEWTASNYLPYPACSFYDEFYGKERFVVRGGSWYASSYECLSTFRFKYTPESDYEDVGIRCAVNP